jgi:hypothetical protein
MTTLPTQVQSGELISAELMNAILGELARLGGSVVPSGSQVVPNLFGTFLGDARVTILQPARQLQLGFTFDVSGAAVDPLAAANFKLIVLNQSPAAEARVAPQTPVNLVVSRSGVGSGSGPGPGPGLPPTITRTETAVGVATTSFAVNGSMVIVGANFSATASENTVTFDGTPATATPDPGDPMRRLSVLVPVGIPNAPVNSGDAAKVGVVVSVQTLVGSPATTTITVTAPVAGTPTIASLSAASPFEGDDLTITGTNLVATAQVLIRGVTAVVVSRNPPTTITVTVPQFADILPGPPVNASLVVHVPAVGDVTFGGTFRVRGANPA